jgi:hypothetical protein
MRRFFLVLVALLATSCAAPAEDEDVDEAEGAVGDDKTPFDWSARVDESTNGLAERLEVTVLADVPIDVPIAGRETVAYRSARFARGSRLPETELSVFSCQLEGNTRRTPEKRASVVSRAEPRTAETTPQGARVARVALRGLRGRAQGWRSSSSGERGHASWRITKPTIDTP